MTKISFVESKILSLVFSGTLALICILLFYAFINIQYGLEDSRTIEAFEVDEAHGLLRIGWNVDNEDFDPRGYYHYPYLWVSFGIVPLRFAREVLDYNVDARFIVGCYRLISLFGGIAAIYFLYRLLLMLGMANAYALWGSAFLLTTPDFYYWCQLLHPDVPQTAVIIAAFIFCFHSSNLRDALAASFLNGAAMAFKFGGAFSFPACFLSLVTRWWSSRKAGEEPCNNRKLIWFAVSCILMFVGVFLVSNPYAVVNAGELVNGVGFIKTTITKPYPGRLSWNYWEWFSVFDTASGRYAARFFLIGLPACVLYSVVDLWRTGWRSAFTNSRVHQVLILCVYVLACFMFMSYLIRWGNLRYAYHFYPFIIALALYGVYRLMNSFPSLVRCILLFPLGLLLIPRASDALARMRFASHKPVSDIVRAASFVEKTYPLDVQIFFEYGALVPAKFTASVTGFGLTRAVLQNNPELRVIVLSAQNTGRWVWKAEGTQFNDRKLVGNPEASEHARNAYQIVHEFMEPNSPWKVVYDHGEIVIFENKNLATQQPLAP